jgi:hypothetical protein
MQCLEYILQIRTWWRPVWLKHATQRGKPKNRGQWCVKATDNNIKKLVHFSKTLGCCGTELLQQVWNPLILLHKRCWALFLWRKTTGMYNVHSSPSNVDVKDPRSLDPFPTTIFHDMALREETASHVPVARSHVKTLVLLSSSLLLYCFFEDDCFMWCCAIIALMMEAINTSEASVNY